jgi:hypothetical protein
MITTATVYTFLFIHLGVILVVTAYYALSAALAPSLTKRARQRFARRPWLPVVVGLLVSAPWVLTSVALMQTGIAGLAFLGAVLGCLWLLCGLIGGAAIAQHVGGRGSSSLSLADTVRGGLLLSLTWVLPLIGWLGMLPLTLATGLGCLILGLFPSGESEPTTPNVDPQTMAILGAPSVIAATSSGV